MPSLVGTSIPAVVTGLVLGERVFAVRGFFGHTKRAIGQAVPPRAIDIPVLPALAPGAGVLIVVRACFATSRSRGSTRGCGRRGASRA